MILIKNDYQIVLKAILEIVQENLTQQTAHTADVATGCAVYWCGVWWPCFARSLGICSSIWVLCWTVRKNHNLNGHTLEVKKAMERDQMGAPTGGRGGAAGGRGAPRGRPNDSISSL